MLKYKPDFDRARLYWQAFWNNEIVDRPCTLIAAPKNKTDCSEAKVQPLSEPFDYSFEQFDNFLEVTEFLGEYIPGFRPDYGPDQMAAFLGAPLVYGSVETSTSWTSKIIEDWRLHMPLQLHSSNTYWTQMQTFHFLAQERYQNKCLIYNIDLHSNIDTLEALCGAERLLFDLIDQPDLVTELMLQVRPIYKTIYNELYKYGYKTQLGTNSAMHLYSIGKTDYIQADFIALLSPKLMHKFVLPAIEEEAQFLDHSCFHLDGPDALKHIDDILAIKSINAVQWLPGAGNKPQHLWPEVLSKIQSAKKSIVVYGTPDIIKSIHKNYDPRYVVYDVTATSVLEGLDLLEWLKANT